MAVLLVLVVLLAALVLLRYALLVRKLKNYPPGPPRLPLVGSLLSTPGELIHLYAAKHWRDKYGPIVGLVLGSKPMVMVCGAEEVIALLNHENSQARPRNFPFTERSFGKRLGVFFSDGPYWTSQRRFTLRHLRDLGWGKSSLEGVVLEEVEATLDDIRQKGPAVQPNTMFNAPVLNALWWMVSGKPFARAEVQSNELLTALNKVMRNKRVGTAPCDIWPVLKHIAPELSCYNEIYKPLFEVQDFLKREIKSQRQQSEVENSLISVYCKEIDKDEQPEFFHEESLITICLDLFLAGGESTANTLSFALLYMGLYPAVQAKLHAELDEVCGAGRTVTLSERQRLPYLEAVMSEVMRINTIAPMAAPHHADADIEINGYTIPKESNLFLSLWSVLNDKKHWVDPESFRPERFIDSEGKYVKDPWLLVFGIGKRVCLGEAFAMQVMFLFFSNLMNHFKFSLPPGSEPPSTVPESGFTTSPKMYTVLAHPRTSS